MTNIIQMLHMTAAYKAAALQLMVNEANFAANQLELHESVPMVAVAKTNDWEVDPAPSGIGGVVLSSNYTFYFHEGRLQSINKYHWLQQVSPPVNDMIELAERPSLLDTNSAYELAKQRLAALGIDVNELEIKHPPVIFQVPARRRDTAGQSLRGVSNNVAVPLFMIGWGEDPVIRDIRERFRTNTMGSANRLPRSRPPSPSCPVFIRILGTTKEVIEFSIRDLTIFKRPVLQLTNAEVLLGDLPPPRHFVEELVGGKEVYETIAHPDKVEAWLLTSSSDEETVGKKKDRVGPKKLDAKSAKMFSDALSDFDSYSWNMGKRCIMDAGARLRFGRGGDQVEFLLCYECSMLEIKHGNYTRITDFDAGRGALIKAIQTVFPDDGVIKNLNALQ